MHIPQLHYKASVKSWSIIISIRRAISVTLVNYQIKSYFQMIQLNIYYFGSMWKNVPARWRKFSKIWTSLYRSWHLFGMQNPNYIFKSTAAGWFSLVSYICSFSYSYRSLYDARHANRLEIRIDWRLVIIRVVVLVLRMMPIK